MLHLPATPNAPSGGAARLARWLVRLAAPFKGVEIVGLREADGAVMLAHYQG